jgi:hypothetical protein
MRMASPTPQMRSAPGRTCVSAVQSSVKVFCWSGWTKARSPSKSMSTPSAWGICFRIRMIPMEASIPLMTVDGK